MAKGRKAGTRRALAILRLSGGVAAVGLAVLAGARVAQAQNTQLPPGAYAGDIAQSDLLQGQNKTGPYSLAWTNIKVNVFQKIVVNVDGKTLPDDAFTVDPVKGLITFKTTLKTGSLANVSYYYDSINSKRNGDFMSAPLNMPQMNIGGTSVQLTALSGNATGSGDTRMIAGAQRTLSLLNGGLTSQMLFTSGGTATKLGYKLGNDKTGIDAQFQRTEKDFAARVGKSLGYGDALQNMSLAARMRSASWLGTTVSRLEQKNLLTSTGKEQTALGVALGGGVFPTLNVAHLADATVATTGQATTVLTDKADLAAKVGTAAFTAKTQRAVTDNPDATSATTQDSTVAVTTPLATKTTSASVSVTTGMTETTAAVQDRQGVAVKIQPVNVLTLSAEQKAQKDTPITGGTLGTSIEQTWQTATAVIAPMPGAKLTGAVQENAVGEAKTASTRLDATVGSGKALEIGGGLTNRSANTTGGLTLDTTQARLALRPMGGLAFTGVYTTNPESNGVVTQAVRQELGVTAKMGTIEFGSGYAMTTLTGLTTVSDDPQYGTISLSLGMQLSKYTKFNGAYKDGLLFGDTTGVAATSMPRGTKVYSLGLTHVVGSDFTFSMNGSKTTDYAALGSPPAYKAEAKVGLRF